MAFLAADPSEKEAFLVPEFLIMLPSLDDDDDAVPTVEFVAEPIGTSQGSSKCC